MAEPSISVIIEPRFALGLVSFLKCAPAALHQRETGLLNLGVFIKNTGTAPMRVTKAEVFVRMPKRQPNPGR